MVKDPCHHPTELGAANCCSVSVVSGVGVIRHFLTVLSLFSFDRFVSRPKEAWMMRTRQRSLQNKVAPLVPRAEPHALVRALPRAVRGLASTRPGGEGRDWMSTSRPTPFSLCKPFSSKGCPGIREPSIVKEPLSSIVESSSSLARECPNDAARSRLLDENGPPRSLNIREQRTTDSHLARHSDNILWGEWRPGELPLLKVSIREFGRDPRTSNTWTAAPGLQGIPIRSRSHAA